MHFCVLSLLATVTLVHRVLFWLFVNYVNALIATRHLQRAEGRVLTSRLSIFPPCQGEASDLLLTEWANSSQGVLEPKRGEEMVQEQSECQALSPIKNILKLCGTIRQSHREWNQVSFTKFCPFHLLILEFCQPLSVSLLFSFYGLPLSGTLITARASWRSPLIISYFPPHPIHSPHCGQDGLRKMYI